ncbi:MAG: SMC-Scp complex subunit ScpB [Planctomycetota bacterium]
MDDISRELPPDSTGATPVSERQKGPEEYAQFERGRVDEDLVVNDRLGGVLGRSFVDAELVDREVRLMAAGDEEVPADGDLPAGDAEPQGGTPEDAEPQELPETEGAAEAPAVEPAAEELAAEDTVAEGTVAEGTVAEETVAGETIVEEVAVEECVVEEAVVVDTPAADEATEEVAADDDIDSDEALAAVAAEAETAEIDEVLGDEEGMPSVPELQDPVEVARVVSVLMLTSREGLSVLRLAQACNTSQKLVEAALEHLKEQFATLGLPIELSRVGDTVRWVSGADAFVYLQRLRGVKKMEKLSPAALETLAVVAYRQPVMRSEIEAIRGVKAGPMLRTLLQHKLIKVAGRADVPGRPLQYGTTQHFLERFGIGSLQELPSVKEWKNLG